MVTLTPNAEKELTSFFSNREKTPIRIYLAPGGCGGPHLGLALDEYRENDSTAEVNGFSFCIQKELQEQVRSVTIDASPMGFSVKPELPLPKPAAGEGCGSSGCGSCCGGCGH